MLKLYGIKNCDTVKKARQWLAQHELPYVFHDYRTDGLDMALLESFEQQLGWENMLNKRSTSWRQLSDAQKTDLDRSKSLQLMLETPTLIKRPILDTGSALLIGFNDKQYQQTLL
ncbi:ArsC family reductase [methane-oxidizing endosymbiont of Gigantopelta aegis]|uniref:ArsC family reductase n=1 Tax=methane-oxidizing endosymbiont of Gigantopelta aegis TaxID=2794938 RepID=UPI0018DDA0CA|nr:ArsC family reductase [methane-oxidizing endosymbiont of Gigantopelta aegis]